MHKLFNMNCHDTFESSCPTCYMREKRIPPTSYLITDPDTWKSVLYYVTGRTDEHGNSLRPWTKQVSYIKPYNRKKELSYMYYMDKHPNFS